MPNVIYRLSDGRLWNTAQARWLEPSDLASLPEEAQTALDNDELEYEENPVIDLVSSSGESDEAYLARTLIFYGYFLGPLAPKIAAYNVPQETAASALKKELAALDAQYLTPRTLADLSQQNPDALARYQIHEAKAEPLRLALAQISNSPNR